MDTRNLLLCCLLILLVTPGLWAQPPGEELETGEVEVIRDFDARLEETEKVYLDPSLPDPAGAQQNLQYPIPTKVLGVEYPAPKIRPLAMGRDKEPEIYRGYARAGFGNFTQPFAEAGYHFLKEDLFEFNVFGRHHSANNDNNRENQRFSLNQIGLDGTYFNEDGGFAVEGRLGFQSDTRHLFGYNDADTSFTKEEVERRINLFEIGARLYNSERNLGDINYSADVNFYSLSENFLASDETGFIVDLLGEKYFDEKHLLSIGITTDFSTFQDTGKQDLHNFFLNPTFTFHEDQFKIKAGVNLASHDDEFFLFPDIEVAVSILGSQLGAFAGWEGSLQKNNFRNLIEYNPWVESQTEVRNTNYNNWYGGIRGSISDYNYEAQVGYKQADDLALFLPLSTTRTNGDTRQFDVLYDTATVVYIQGTITGQATEDLQVAATLGQSFFSFENADKAWGLPSLELNASATYTTFDDKAHITAEFYAADGIPYLDEELENKRLDPLYDLSLGAEYFFTEQVGAWLQFNNLLDNKRERWQRYPMLGFNVMGGVVAKF